MKTIEFKKDSWYYKFVSKTTGYFENLRYAEAKPDICSFTRAFIAGVIKSAVVLFFISQVVGGLLIGAMAFVAYLLHITLWTWLSALTPLGALMWILASAFFFGAGLVRGITWLQDHHKDKVAKEPGPIKTMYKHWKEKTCALIEFK